MFYASLVPLATFVGLFQLIIYYIIDKYNLLKRRCIISTYDARLTLKVLNLVELGLVIQCVGHVYFTWRVRDLIVKGEVGLMVICILIFILPIDTFFNKVANYTLSYSKSTTMDISDNIDFSEARKHFLTVNIKYKYFRTITLKIRSADVDLLTYSPL